MEYKYEQRPKSKTYIKGVKALGKKPRSKT